ncbi:MAG: EAL domain-containing protein [Nitrospirae bacterium]|nr:EAL domain-containing protein [Nitrospirota bacterium]
MEFKPDKDDIKLFNFLETLSIGIFVLDAKGSPYFANTTAREIIGKGIAENAGTTATSEIFDAYIAYTDQPYPEEKMPLTRALSGETTTVDDMEIRRNGKSIYLEVTGYPVFDSKGTLLYAVAAFIDITSLKETVNRNADYILKLEEYASQLMITEEKLQQSYETTRNILEKSPLGIVLVNEDGSVEYVNQSMLDLGGASREQFKSVNFFKFEKYKEISLDSLIRGVFNGTSFSTDEIEYTSHFANKSSVRKFTGIPFREGNESKALIFVEDRTEQNKARKVLREAKEDWENTFNSIADMITIHDCEFNIAQANAAAREALHLDLSQPGASKCFEHFHGLKEPHKECPGCISLKTRKYSVTEMFEPKLNKFIELRVTPRFNAKNDMTGFIHVVRDITERKKLEQELMHQALYDALTNLPNRILLIDRIQNLYDHRKRRKDLLFAALFIDLDNFKKINDSFGHIVGDELLVSVAKRLSECTRPGDTISRFGGDEFVILLDELDSQDDAIGIAERIRQTLASVFFLKGHELFISASTGIAMADISADSPQDLLRNADIAMYNAKTSGKANYALFDASMHSAVIDSLNMENDLRKAIAKNEITVNYQPIIDIHTKKVAGFEALARWLHPKQGQIAPGIFIPVAEQTGLIDSIGKLVLKDACENIHKLNSQFELDTSLYVSVNLSAKQFNSSLPQIISDVLSKSGLESNNLRLEITESTIMENIFVAASILDELKGIGVQIYLDDFGTGYSSLNYLHKFPVNALKIDPSFTKNIQDDAQAREILLSIQALTNNLEMKMIIEGVEDQSQLTTFKDLNCQYIQGYLFSRPLPTAELFAFMQNSKGFVAQVTDNTA